MSITLPEKPGANEYEDLVSGTLLGLGHFVECNLKLREGTSEVLELDVVATPAGANFNQRKLFDAKTGSSGFRDIFTLFGWMTYLGIKEGCITHRDPLDVKRLEAFAKVATDTNARCCHFSTASKATDLAPAPVNLPEQLRDKLISAAWFSKIVQRAALAAFNSYCKSSGSELVEDAKKYQNALQQAFFAKSAISRVHALYEAWQSSPNLCGKLVAQHSGDKDQKIIWEEFADSNNKLWLQYVAILEHHARLGIIKNAIDHLIEAEAGGGKETIKIGASTISWSDMLEHLAPRSFREAMEELRKHPHRNKIPLLLQLFVEVFGGFYLISTKDDIDAMSSVTGIPSDDIGPCLAFIDKFFPYEKGWFFNQKDEICRMKMVPAIYRGIGCLFRRSLYDLKEYTDKFPKQGWLLSRWHNATYNALKPVLGQDAANPPTDKAKK